MVSPFVLVFLLLPSLSKCDMVPPVKMPLRLTTGGDHSDPIATWNAVLTTTTMAALTAMPLQNFSQQCSATVPPSNPYLHLIHAKNEPSNPPAIHHHSVTSASECQFGTCNALCAGLPVTSQTRFNTTLQPPQYTPNCASPQTP